MQGVGISIAAPGTLALLIIGALPSEPSHRAGVWRVTSVSSNAWHWRSAPSFVDKIVRGEHPAGIAVVQPNEFDLVINLNTAKALGITMPQSLLQRADEVIR